MARKMQINSQFSRVSEVVHQKKPATMQAPLASFVDSFHRLLVHSEWVLQGKFLIWFEVDSRATDFGTDACPR